MDFEQLMIFKVAWYYYIEGLTQKQITERLNISRQHVIRMLGLARESGVISFQIRRDQKSRLESEKFLIDRFGLKDALVAPLSTELVNLNENIAQAAAMYISNFVEDEGYINLGYGDTPTRVLNHLAVTVSKPIHVVSFTGGVSYYLPTTFGRAFKAKIHLIPTPLLVSTEELRDALEEEATVKYFRKMVDLSTVSVIGIGGMGDDATILQQGIFTHEDFMLLRMSGAVGDILSHFLDQNGNPMDTPFEKRLISTPLERLKALKNVIAVAGGVSKVDAIVAALKGGYVDVLITDEDTASRILAKEDA